jgi:chemotaxis protein MotB
MTEQQDGEDADAAPEPPPARRRRRVDLAGGAPAAGGDEWMLTYMDTVTLLVTLFVLLLSFSTINAEKFDSVANALSLKKYGKGILTGKVVPIQKPAEFPPKPEEPAAPADKAADLAEGLRSELADQGLTDLVEMTVHENVVDLQLNESVLFQTGEAVLIDSGRAVVEKLVPFLGKTAFPVSVQGHTDNVPIRTDLYPSNWELSAARAASVARAFIEGGIDRDRVEIRGYAETRPVASNDTVEGRARNRRVNLVLQMSEDAADADAALGGKR